MFYLKTLKKKNLIILFGVILLTFTIGFNMSNVAFAQDDDPFADEFDSAGSGGGNAASSSSSGGRGSSSVMDLKVYQPKFPDKDPFKPLVTKRKKRKQNVLSFRERAKALNALRERTKKRSSNSSAVASRAMVPPLNIEIQGIIGNESRRLAIVKFQGSIEILGKGETKGNFFKIIDVTNTKVMIYSFQRRRRRTLEVKHK